MRHLLLLGVLVFLTGTSFGQGAEGIEAGAQTITVRNFLHVAAPIVRESLAAIEGDNFTDVDLVEPFSPPTTLGGVTVTVNGVPQRIRSVSRTLVVFIVDAGGSGLRAVELRTKTNVVHRSSFQVATAWPGLFVQSTGEDSEAFIPSGLWTTDGIQLLPLTSAPIQVGPANRPTLVILQGSGWRQGTMMGGVQVRLNGIACPLVAARSSALFAGQDELVFQVPAMLAGRGVMDMVVTVAGRESNYARINLGNAITTSAKASGAATPKRQ